MEISEQKIYAFFNLLFVFYSPNILIILSLVLIVYLFFRSTTNLELFV